MRKAEDVRNNLEFKRVEPGLISYHLSNNANGDNWRNILVIYNARTTAVDYGLEEEWQAALLGNEFNSLNKISGSVEVPAISTVILFQE